MYIGAGHLNPISRVFQDIFSWQSLFLFACTIALCVVWQLVVFVKERKTEGQKRSVKYFIAVSLFLLYLMLVYRQTGMSGFVWWMREPLISPDRIELIPFASSSDMIPHVYNVFMTIPFGFLLPAIWPVFRSLKKVALAGFLFSLTIETMQLFTNRVTTIDDLIMNTLGAVIGYLIFQALFRIFRRTGKREAVHVGRKPRYEAVIYIALSLIGVIFLHHPAIVTRIPSPAISMDDVVFGTSEGYLPTTQFDPAEMERERPDEMLELHGYWHGDDFFAVKIVALRNHL